MTKIRISRKNGQITAVEAEGHTGYAEAGEDIVCASVSSLVQTALLGLLQVAGIAAVYKRDDEKGYFSFQLPELNESDRNNADMILETMACGLLDLYEGYSDFIELEVITCL